MKTWISTGSRQDKKGQEERKKTENQKELSKVFCEAIKTLAEKPENLENLELYLSSHFETWLEKFAYDPASLAYELKMFAEMEI